MTLEKEVRGYRGGPCWSRWWPFWWQPVGRWRKRVRRAPGPEQVKFNAGDGQSDNRLLELAERMRSAIKSAA